MTLRSNTPIAFSVSALLLLTCSIFIIDVSAPPGWAAWLLYLLPLVVALRSVPRRSPYEFAAGLTVLIALGGYLSAGEPAFRLTLWNRGLGILVIWGLVWLLRGHDRSRQQVEPRPEARDEVYRQLVDRVRDYAIFLLNPEGVVVTWNEGAKRLKGYEAEEIIGRHFSRFYRAEDRAVGHPDLLLQRAKEDGHVVDEGWRVRKDGTQFFADVALTALRDAQGHLTGFAKVTRDVTERNRLTEQFRVAVEAAPSGMVLIDEEGTIQLVNAQVERLFGYTRDELIGRSVEILVPDVAKDSHGALRARFMAEPQARQMGGGRELNGLCRDGTVFPIEIGLNPIRTKDGLRVLAAIVDITERKRLQRDLEERESLLRTIIETEPECVKVLNLDGTVRSMNLAGLAMVEAGTTEEIVGKDVCQLVTPAFRSAFAELTGRAARGETGVLEFQMVGLKGARRWLETHLVPLRDVRGAITGVLGVTRDITTRKDVESALSLSEERLQNILNSMEEVVWSSSLDFSEVLYVSPAVMKIYGVASADFIVHPSLWIDMIHPADRLIAEAAIRDTAEGRAFDVQYRIVRPDGGIRWIRDRGRIIRDEQGQALRIDGVAADVTEKRTAEQALRGAEERFEDIFEASKDAIGYASLDGTFVLANDAFARLTGYSKQELLTRTYRDLTPPEYREIQAEVIAGVLKTGEPREYEKVYVQRDGSRIPVSLTVFAVKGEDGRPAGVAAIVRDITERKKTEEALRTSAARLQSAIAAANVGTWMVDLKTKMDTRDSGLNRMLGLLPVESSQPLEDFIGRIHPEDRAACAQAWAEAIEVTRIYDVTHRIIRGDGEIRWFRNRGQVAVDAEDRPLHAIGACVDVTDQRNLEEQLRRTERIAELGTLASGMAHEIGTPMNVILGRAEYLMQRVKEEPIKRGLQTIVGQVERITRVMNQLLSFARRRTPERRSLDLKGTIEDNLEIFEERLARAQVRLEVSFPDSCPPVHADPDQMSQVLINLVMNAIHAMPDGGTLRIGLTPASGRVLLTVSDTGHGIPKDVIAKIFDPFFTTKEFGKGTGLGLTVVKGIIEEHQGTIVVESEPNRGTTFTISLPIHKGL